MQKTLLNKILLIVLLSSFGSVYAQLPEYPYEIKFYDFINYKKNVLKFPGDSTSFINFFTKYKNIILKGEGQLEIVHIGGSHIQADIYTNRMRERMQSFYPGLNGGRGFIFPFKMAKTNNPYNYVVKYTGSWNYCKNVQRKSNCNFGLSGYQVSTSDSVSEITIYSRENYPLYDFNKIKIFYNLSDSLGYEVNVLSNSLVTKTDFPDKHYSEYQLEKYCDTIRIQIIKTDTIKKRFELYGIKSETDDPGIIYDAIGVNGASVPSFMKCNMFEENLEVIKPDMVVLSLGTNDAYGTKFDKNIYKNNYDTLIQRILKANPNTAIMITVPNDDYLYKKYPNKNTALQEEVIMELAKKYNAAVWDLYEIMGGFNSSQVWYNNHLMKRDRIHFTKEGYMLKGDLFFNSFIKFYDKIVK